MRLSLLVLALVPVRSEEPLYKQAGAPIPARVADLIARMTPTELIVQLQNKNEGGWDQIPNITAEYGATGIGSLFLDEMQNRSWGYYPTSTPLDTLRARNALQRSFLSSTRLSIPISFCEELLHSERGAVS
jgi:beta-glucosidase